MQSSPLTQNAASPRYTAGFRLQDCNLCAQVLSVEDATLVFNAAVIMDTLIIVRTENFESGRLLLPVFV